MKASDYQPSDDEEGLGGERYLERAKGMVKSTRQRFGLEIGTWSDLFRYGKQHNHKVKQVA